MLDNQDQVHFLRVCSLKNGFLTVYLLDIVHILVCNSLQHKNSVDSTTFFASEEVICPMFLHNMLAIDILIESITLE